MRTACNTAPSKSRNNIPGASVYWEDISDEELTAASTMRLSNYFNSSEATMRLAEMTAPGYVEELGKTLNIKRPMMNSLNSATLQLDNSAEFNNKLPGNKQWWKF